MAKAILLLGTNLGDKKGILIAAIDSLNLMVGEVSKQSNIYKTPAWGFESGNDFYNQVVIVHTQLSPENLLQQLKKLELELGRDPLKQSKKGVYQDRLIDIDILFYDDLIYHSEQLTVPHPRMHLRSFTLIPLNEFCSDYIHPALKKSIQTLVNECADEVVPIPVT